MRRVAAAMMVLALAALMLPSEAKAQALSVPTRLADEADARSAGALLIAVSRAVPCLPNDSARLRELVALVLNHYRRSGSPEPLVSYAAGMAFAAEALAVVDTRNLAGAALETHCNAAMGAATAAMADLARLARR